MAPQGFGDKVAFVWKVADKLRGTFKQHEYGSVMLPLLVLRRMDAVLASTKDAVLDQAVRLGALEADRKSTGKAVDEGMDYVLKHVAGQRFYSLSPLTFTSMLQSDKELAEQLASYIRRLSPDAYRVIEAYNLDAKIARMDRAEILYPVLADFADLDLRPNAVSNEAMGYIFEELLRKFSEMSNETAGEHYTPREVIELMVALLLHGQTSSELIRSRCAGSTTRPRAPAGCSWAPRTASVKPTTRRGSRRRRPLPRQRPDGPSSGWSADPLRRQVDFQAPCRRSTGQTAAAAAPTAHRLAKRVPRQDHLPRQRPCPCTRPQARTGTTACRESPVARAAARVAPDDQVAPAPHRRRRPRGDPP